MFIPHPAFATLAARCVELAKDAAVEVSGLGFRFVALKYAHANDLLSGEGAKMSGGRVNRAGTFPMIYTSTDPQTATAETFQNFSAFGFDRNKVRPKLLVGVEVKLAAALDLTDRQIRRRLRVSLPDLAQAWWPVQEAGNEPLTQAIGRAAYDAGFEAVRMPSARRKGGVNLNIFPENLRAGSYVRVLAQDELQRNLK